MNRIKMIIEYDGTNYHGFQSQKNANTIQDEIVRGIEKLTKEQVTIICAGRTDAGVHALGQVIAFDTESSIPPERFYLALNSLLPVDIKVLKSMAVSPDFNPRFDAIQKTYHYLIYRKREKTTFFRNYAYCTTEALDISEMNKACQYIEGRHNFRAFCTSGSSAKTFERTVKYCRILEKDPYLILDITGDGFLYNMVRIITGTLLEIGRGKMPANMIEKIIDSRNRSLAGPTIAPQGLYLVKVEYPQ